MLVNISQDITMPPTARRHADDERHRNDESRHGHASLMRVTGEPVDAVLPSTTSRCRRTVAAIGMSNSQRQPLRLLFEEIASFPDRAQQAHENESIVTQNTSEQIAG